MSERENRDAARSLSVVHYMDRDLHAVAALAAGLVERGNAGEGSPSLIAILPTADDALAFSEHVLRQRRGASNALTPVTSLARGRRIIESNAAAIAAAPGTLARLISESRLNLSQTSTLLVVWPEEMVRDDEQRAFLESVVAEVSRSAARVAFCVEKTPELAQFLERSMWRAREVDHRTTPTAQSAVALRALTTPAAERTRAVRSVLDSFDPPSAALIAFTDAGEADAREAASLLGPSVDVVRGIPEQRFAIGILYDVPDADALTSLAGMVNEVVAVVTPARLPALQKVAASVTPVTWTGVLANNRLTLDALRDEIRGYVASGGHTSWIPVVEPLLEGLDPVEVAAAAIAMLDRERRKARRVVQPVAAAAPVSDRPVREERSSFRPRPERRDDERSGRPRPERRDDARSGRPRPERRGEERSGFASRPDRGGDDRGRPARGFAGKRPWRDEGRDRGDAPRGPRRDMADRPPRDRGRRDDIERVPRAAREGREWSERGERLRHSRRGPRGGDAG